MGIFICLCLPRIALFLLDVNMADGYRPNGDDITTIKVGFLNRKIESHFEKFAESFDIVLTDDQTVNVPRKIVEIASSKNLETEN